MKKRTLGRTGIEVTPLGLGTLTMGPFQLNMDQDVGAGLIAKAVKMGINLIDTAKAYRTYPYVKKALEMLKEEEKKNLCIIGRSYDYTRAGMEESFNEALREMGTDRISIFMLHEQESALTLQGHREALLYLKSLKNRGELKAAGISTHYIAAVRAAAEDPLVDVIFAVLNIEGLGIMDGSRADMEEALRYAESRGKGILLMKAMGGGHFFRNAPESLEYAGNLPFVHSVILGMQDTRELDYNISLFENNFSGSCAPLPVRREGRRLFIEEWCRGCGECAKHCPFRAISIIEGRARVDKKKCMLCSYCASRCPDFCIKVV